MASVVLPIIQFNFKCSELRFGPNIFGYAIRQPVGMAFSQHHFARCYVNATNVEGIEQYQQKKNADKQNDIILCFSSSFISHSTEEEKKRE